MKLVKSLLLGSAAGIAAVAGAQAADLPSRKAAPVEYVRVCSAYGAGFFYIPGTDTCLRVGGRVRAEYAIGTRFGDFQDAYGTRARGRLNVDARTATAYGTLRTFFRFEITNNTGIYNAGSVTPFNTGAMVPGPFRNTALPGTNTELVDLAFVQFGPITAGRAQSFFDFYANDYGFNSVRTADSRVNLLAYTATFGSGFSATISAEDRVSGTVNRELPGAVIDPISGIVTSNAVVQGQDYPDLVASLRVDQGWGSAQLSGALGQRKYSTGLPTILNPSPVDGDEMVWAIQGGVKINLPMLAAGDNLILQAAYADGALGYIGWNAGTFGLGRLGGLFLADASLNPVTGNVDNSTGWSLVAAFKHFWTPQLRTEIFGSYSQLELGYTDVNSFGAFPRSLDPKEYIIAANLIWSPVSGLDIGVEVLYSHLDVRNRVAEMQNTGFRNPLVGIKNDDAWAGRFRIQRDF